MTTPNWSYLRSNLPSYEGLGDPARFEHLQFTADGDGHFFAYKASELTEIFRQAGFGNFRCKFFEVAIYLRSFEVAVLPSRTTV